VSRDARKLYRQFACVYPGCVRTPTCFAHYPRHRGIGGRNAGWGLFEGAPCCDYHHRILDGHKPGDLSREQFENVRQQIVGAIYYFWAAILDGPLMREYDPGPMERIEAVRAFAIAEVPAYRRRRFGLVKLPPYTPRDWLMPDEADLAWSFDEDGEGAASIDVPADCGE